MITKILNFVKRPFVGDQTTGREAWLGYQGQSFSGINGNGGQQVLRSMNAVNPATVVPGPTLKPLDASVTGNPAWALTVQPLDDSKQF